MPIEAIQSALSGLNTAQRLADVVSQNISNANTTGYTRKLQPVNTVDFGGEQVGVRYGAVQRTVDTALQRDLWSQVGQTGASTVTQSYLDRVQQLLGQPNQAGTFASTLNQLGSDFSQLSGAPESSSLQRSAVNDATAFASQLNHVTGTLTELRNDTQTDISASVETINQNLQTIATLNTQIARETLSGQGTADLEDQRDQALQSLSEQMDISSYRTSANVLVVQTANGQPLADLQPHSLTFSPTQLSATSSYAGGSAAAVKLDGTIDLTAPGKRPGGKLGALLALRDDTLPQAQAQLDEVAERTAVRFNAQGLKLFTDASGNVPADNAGSYVGFAGTIVVNPAVTNDPSQVQSGGGAIAAGSNALIDKIVSYTFGVSADSTGTPHAPFRTSGLGPAGTDSTGLPSNAALGDYATSIVSFQADQAATAKSTLDSDTTYRDALQKRVTDTSGVSMDTELQQLTVIQRSYQASAQIINTVNQLFSSLLSAVNG